MNNFSLKLNNVSKTYEGLDAPIFSNLNLEINQGTHIAVTGVSGSGKSTLLNLMAGLDRPSKGQVFLNDISFDYSNQTELSKFRNIHYGFIYQFHHLLPDFTALENALLPLLVRRQKIENIRDEGLKLLDKLGLKNRINHMPHELSGGERQRVAIARALIHRPSIILADEPTGNLDYKNANLVFEMFLEVAKETKTAIVLVTHDVEIASKMDKICHLNEGKLFFK
ncbi:MAG: ABC transporter ATP-binding protein [Methylophilaceae bacterium]